MSKTSSRKTGAKSQLLEQCVESLTFIAFVVYQTLENFHKSRVTTDYYVIRNYPHKSLYGTPGRKEALIVGPANCNEVVSDPDGNARCIVECKYQDGSGSVDEKLPYVYEHFLASEIKNWIIILDGKYWRTNKRALAGLRWLKARQVPEGRRLIIVNRKEFNSIAKHIWGSK